MEGDVGEAGETGTNLGCMSLWTPAVRLRTGHYWLIKEPNRTIDLFAHPQPARWIRMVYGGFAGDLRGHYIQSECSRVGNLPPCV